MGNVQKHNIYINTIEKLPAAQLIKNLAAFYRNPKFNYLCLQKPATGAYLEPDESIPYHPKRG
jgi:hypothetical protein